MDKIIIINRLNSFCMLLVIMLHCVLRADSSVGESFYLFIYYGFSRIAVPLFFIISSYLLFKNYTVNKIFKRTKTILLPFLLWSIISYFIFVIFPTISCFSSFFNNKTELSVSSFLFYTFISPKNGSLWFLRDLYILVLLSPIIYYICKRTLFSIILFIILWINWLFDYKYSFFVDSSLFYFIGAYISVNNFPIIGNKLYKCVKKLASVFFIIVLVGCLMLPLMTLYYKLNPMLITKIIILFGCLSIWGSLEFFNKKNILLSFLDAFKKYSFFVFASHLIFAQFIRKILLRIFVIDNLLSIIFVYCLLVASVLFVSCILQRILCKYSLNTLRVLTGERC